MAWRGDERVRWGIDWFGWGWLRWDNRARTRFAPDESPIRVILEGSFLRFVIRCERIMVACWSCRGYFARGTRSGGLSVWYCAKVE